MRLQSLSPVAIPRWRAMPTGHGSRESTKHGEPSSARLSAENLVTSTHGALPSSLTTLPLVESRVASTDTAPSLGSSCIAGSGAVAMPRKPHEPSFSGWLPCRRCTEFRRRATSTISRRLACLRNSGCGANASYVDGPSGRISLGSRFGMRFYTRGCARPNTPLQLTGLGLPEIW
jgi:hypothetical protein